MARPLEIITENLYQKALDYVLTNGLENITFRSLAKALGISTYPLIQRFGTRAELEKTLILGLFQTMDSYRKETMTNSPWADMFLATIFFAWKHPKAYPALRDAIQTDLQERVNQEIEQATASSGDFEDFTQEEKDLAMGRIVIFFHGMAQLAHQGMLYQPTQQGIIGFFCNAINDLIFGGKHARLVPRG